MLERMEFNEMDRLRGNPASLKAARGCGCGGGNHPKATYGISTNEGKYTVGKSNKGYNLDKDYFNQPSRTSTYLAAPNSIYRAFSYQIKASNVERPSLIQARNITTPVIQNRQSDLESLEALIMAAKEKEASRWIQ